MSTFLGGGSGVTMVRGLWGKGQGEGRVACLSVHKSEREGWSGCVSEGGRGVIRVCVHVCVHTCVCVLGGGTIAVCCTFMLMPRPAEPVT